MNIYYGNLNYWHILLLKTIYWNYGIEKITVSNMKEHLIDTSMVFNLTRICLFSKMFEQRENA